MQTQTVGDLLRSAREKARVSLAELADHTHIKLEYLEALEDNDFDALPAATFVKAYIRNYARVFQFDQKPLLAILRRDYEESVKGQLIRREILAPRLVRKNFYSPVQSIVLVVATVFVVAFSYALWQWYLLTRPPVLIVTTPAENDRVAARVILEGQTNPAATLTVNTMPVALQADGSFQTEIYLPQAGANTITVKAIDKNNRESLVQRTVVVEF